MTPEERTEYVKYRIEKAYQTYEAAKVLSENGFWNSAVNRLYYTLFFAANALLVLKGIETKRHATLKSQFSQHFVKKRHNNEKQTFKTDNIYPDFTIRDNSGNFSKTK